MWSNGLKQMRHLNVVYLLVAVVVLNPSSTAAYFEGCDHTFSINPGYSYLESPNYPAVYPKNTSCRYKFNAPLDYEIAINCTINLDMGSNACNTEFFYVARDGDEYLRGSEQFCGEGIIERKSLFRSVVFAYISGGSWGSFRCQMHVTPQACDCGWSVNTKIVNGQETAVNEYPGMVALKTSAEEPPFCSGTIISHYYVLTAAHCTQLVPYPSSYIIKAGDHNLASNTETKYAVNYYVAQIIQHPAYTSTPTMNNDISLLRTTTAIEWSRGVGPMCLPPPGSTASDFTYTYVDLIGWGTTSFAGPFSDTLQKATVIITDNESCARTYNDTTIYPSQICTYDYMGTSKDSCQYDSGGPVIRRGVRQFLLGCISFGKFCGQGGYATGINTRISSYLTWIFQNTGYSTCVVPL